MQRNELARRIGFTVRYASRSHTHAGSDRPRPRDASTHTSHWRRRTRRCFDVQVGAQHRAVCYTSGNGLQCDSQIRSNLVTASGMCAADVLRSLVSAARDNIVSGCSDCVNPLDRLVRRWYTMGYQIYERGTCPVQYKAFCTVQSFKHDTTRCHDHITLLLASRCHAAQRTGEGLRNSPQATVRICLPLPQQRRLPSYAAPSLGSRNMPGSHADVAQAAYARCVTCTCRNAGRNRHACAASSLQGCPHAVHSLNTQSFSFATMDNDVNVSAEDNTLSKSLTSNGPSTCKSSQQSDAPTCGDDACVFSSSMQHPRAVSDQEDTCACTERMITAHPYVRTTLSTRHVTSLEQWPWLSSRVVTHLERTQRCRKSYAAHRQDGALSFAVACQLE